MTDRGNWICTKSGTRFFPLDPRPEEVNFMDVAHALSLKCRWGGHCNHFYSVAQHCQRVADVAVVNFRKAHRGEWNRYKAQDERYVELFALLHDAHEAYLTDMPKPLKANLDWTKYEQKVDKAIFGKLGMAWLPSISYWESLVKRADSVLLRIEATELFDPQLAKIEQWGFSGVEPAPWEAAAAMVSKNLTEPHDPASEADRYLRRVNDLVSAINLNTEVD